MACPNISSSSARALALADVLYELGDVELAARHGDRFTPPKLLVDMAEKGETFG